MCIPDEKFGGAKHNHPWGGALELGFVHGYGCSVAGSFPPWHFDPMLTHGSSSSLGSCFSRFILVFLGGKP